MKKKFALLLVLALMINVLLPLTNAEAAVALNKKKLLLEVGSTITLKLNSAKGSVSWKTENKNIATVSKGKVKAVKPGTTKIFATNDGKTYTCVVNVVDSSKVYPDEFSEKAVAKKIKLTTKYTWETGKYRTFILEFKNGSDYSINADVSLNFVDKSGNVIEVKTASLYFFGAGANEYYIAMVDSKATDVEATYKIKEKATIESLGNSIYTDVSIKNDIVTLNATNNGYACANDVVVFVACYKDGKVSDYLRYYVNSTEHDGSYLNPGESVKLTKTTYKVDDVKVIGVTGYKNR